MISPDVDRHFVGGIFGIEGPAQQVHEHEQQEMKESQSGKIVKRMNGQETAVDAEREESCQRREGKAQRQDITDQVGRDAFVQDDFRLFPVDENAEQVIQQVSAPESDKSE